MPRAGSPYGPSYQRARQLLLGAPCALRLVCNGSPADSADHVPPLSMHRHVEGSGCCVLRPACKRCQSSQGHQLAKIKRSRGLRRVAPFASRSW